MKICWDNLEGVGLTKKGNFYKEYYYPSRKTRKPMFYGDKCAFCGEPYLSVKRMAKTCSLTCSAKKSNHGYKLENHPNWNSEGTYIDSIGYVVNRSKRGKNGQHMRQHRVVGEKVLGRLLKHGEVVHHINGNKSDNRNTNLLICSNSYHRWLHDEMSRLYMQEKFNGSHHELD